MLRRAPIRYAHNGDVSIAYTVFGEGPVDVLFIGGFVGHLEIALEPPLAERWAPSAAADPEAREWWARWLRSGAASGWSSAS